MKLFVATSILILTSCNASKQVLNPEKISISLIKTQCGSYEVKNNESTIGYVVKPFIVETNRVNEITNFEKLVNRSYNNSYRNDYRIYLFTKNSIGDTVLNVIMIRPKKAGTIPNWRCVEQDVDTYWRKRHAKNPKMINYNCSKGRFKIFGDPD